MKIYILVFSIFFLSCQTNDVEGYLGNGLENYSKVRYLNENFINGYGIDKIAFHRIDSSTLKVVLKLNDHNKKETIDSLSLGAYVFMKNEYIAVINGKLDWNTKPQLININNYNYY